MADLERVYEAALAVELKRAGIAFQKQVPLPVQYRGESVGEYVCDFAVGDKLIVEIKALRVLTSEHEAQVLNYLKASGMQVGLLLNFGSPRLGVRRVVRGHDDAYPI
ncbi:GxxExxY protein [Metallibacterium scheffleri]|jgi:GxxExxY protein|uniref:GxxExxY protein n=2 Tax=Metallibacterium TaxID=1218803 RepID=UPI0026EB5FEB|nr:GxxExxY protein [Metallibacterium scheffleri]